MKLKIEKFVIGSACFAIALTCIAVQKQSNAVQSHAAHIPTIKEAFSSCITIWQTAKSPLEKVSQSSSKTEDSRRSVTRSELQRMFFKGVVHKSQLNLVTALYTVYKVDSQFAYGVDSEGYEIVLDKPINYEPGDQVIVTTEDDDSIKQVFPVKDIQSFEEVKPLFDIQGAYEILL